MKRVLIMGAAFLAVSTLYKMPVHAEGTIADAIASVGVGEVLELDKTEEEFKEFISNVTNTPVVPVS